MQLASQIEEIAKAARFSEIPEPLADLRQLVERVYAEINEFLDTQ